MPKAWFLSYAGKCLAPSRFKLMLELAGFDGNRVRLVMDRFSRCKTLEQCAEYYPEDQQKEHMPDLDCQAEGWSEANMNFYTPKERKGLYSYLLTGKPCRKRE